MLKKLLVLLFIIPVFGYAETIRTSVLVVGGTASGVAAAIQSSRSKIKTVLVEPGPWLGGEMTSGGMCILDGNRNLPSGTWGEFRKHVRDFYKKTAGYDTAMNAALRFEPYTGAAILRKMCDTAKNLTLKINTTFTDVKKDGNGWEVTVTTGGKPITIKAKVLIDATPTADVAAKAGAKMITGFDARKETGEALAPETALPYIEDVTWCAVVKDFGSGDHTIAKPSGYDASRYACLKDADVKKMLEGGKLPNKKYLIKWGACGNSFGATPEQLSAEKRDDYYKGLRLQVLGLIYYIQTEKGLKNIGLAEHEFETPDNLPSIPYMREYRRMTGIVRMTTNEIYTPYANTLYRTSIAVGDAGFGQHYATPDAPKINYPSQPGYSVPLGAVVNRDLTNLLVTEKAISATHLVNASTFYPSVQMTLGQGVGATAAFCAFFDKTTKNLDVRLIQQEILDYKGLLYPFVDVPVTDRYVRAIQQIAATGLLKGVQEGKGKIGQTLFKPDSTVSTADIKPVLYEIYTRSFIWFNKNKPAQQFSIADLLSFICDQTLAEPKPFQNKMQQEWQTVYKFKQPFDLNRPVTRYEFAVLLNRYVNPFKTKVNLAGKIVN